MNRAEFMRQLDSLLQNIPQTEREAALQYYNDYFDDAGAENERDVLEALGTPARVAENIKRDMTLSGGNGSKAPYNDGRDCGSEDGQGNSVRNPVIRFGDAGNPENPDTTVQKNNNTVFTVLSILAAVFLFPIGLGLASALVSALLGLFIGWFSLILGFAAAALALLLVLVALLVAGAVCLAESPLAGVAVMGVGLILGGIGILFAMLTVALAGIVTPWLFRGLCALWKWCVEKIRSFEGKKVAGS